MHNVESPFDVLFLLGDIEEFLAQANHALPKIIWYPDVLEVEEAHLHERVPELLEKLRLRLRVSRQGEVKDGDRLE